MAPLDSIRPGEPDDAASAEVPRYIEEARTRLRAMPARLDKPGMDPEALAARLDACFTAAPEASTGDASVVRVPVRSRPVPAGRDAGAARVPEVLPAAKPLTREELRTAVLERTIDRFVDELIAARAQQAAAREGADDRLAEKVVQKLLARMRQDEQAAPHRG